MELPRLIRAVTRIWHGSASIGEANGTIMFADYHDNGAKYTAPYNSSKEHWLPLMHPNSVHRSRDGGLTWETVFTKSPEEITALSHLRSRRVQAGRMVVLLGRQGL